MPPRHHRYTNEQEDLQRTRKAATHGQPINIPVVSLSGGGWYPERKPDTSSEKKKLAESAVAPPWGVIGGMCVCGALPAVPSCRPN